MDISDDQLARIMRDTANGKCFGWIAHQMGFNEADVRQHIFNDDQLKQQFYDAQEIGAEALADRALTIAQEEEDPVKAKIQIDTIKFLVESRAKERYGKQAKEQQININLIEAMEDANKRLIEQGPVYDAKLKEQVRLEFEQREKDNAGNSDRDAST